MWFPSPRGSILESRGGRPAARWYLILFTALGGVWIVCGFIWPERLFSFGSIGALWILMAIAGFRHREKWAKNRAARKARREARRKAKANR